MQRLGLNQGRYFGEGIDIDPVLLRLGASADKHGWRPERFTLPELAGNPVAELLAWNRSPKRPRKRVYLSTGIHGDEPAGPLALERLVTENLWPDDLELVICPCLNRSGFPRNTRENAEGIDLNRDYREPVTAEVRNHVAWLERQTLFDLTLCLHEDWEAHGFYLYELNPERRPSLAERMVAAVAEVCPIDASAEIDGRPTAAPGIIRPDIDPAKRPAWAEAFYLIQRKTRWSYTLEAPSDWPLALRADVLVRAVRAALEGI